MQIIFTETWMAWMVGIIISLVIIKQIVMILILIRGLRVTKKIESMTEDFADWSNYAMDEVTATLEDISNLRASLKSYFSIAGLTTLISKIFKNNK